MGVEGKAGAGSLEGVVKEFREVVHNVPSVTCAKLLDLLVEFINRWKARVDEGLGNCRKEDMLCGLASLQGDALGNIDGIIFDIQVHWLGKWWEVEERKDPIIAKSVVLIVLLDEGSWLLLVVSVTGEWRVTYKAWLGHRACFGESDLAVGISRPWSLCMDKGAGGWFGCRI